MYKESEKTIESSPANSVKGLTGEDSFCMASRADSDVDRSLIHRVHYGSVAQSQFFYV